MPRVRTIDETDLAAIAEVRAGTGDELRRQTLEQIDAMLDAGGVTNPARRLEAHAKAIAWLEREGQAMLSATLAKFEQALKTGRASVEN